MTGTDRRPLRLAALMLSCSLVALTVPLGTPVAAQEATTSINIPARPLGRALADFGAATGWRVAYTFTLPSGATSQPVSGTMAPEQALVQILAGSGIGYRFTGPGAVVLTAPAGAVDAELIAPDGSVMLGTIVISGGSLGSHYLTYESTGSVEYRSGEEIERWRGSSAGDMLSGTPGVLNGENRNSGALDVNIRGMQGQGRVPVMIDGATQEHTAYRGYNGAAARSYVDPDLIGEMVIEKGPSAAADAAGATGGVVRISTIGVNDILLPGRKWGFRIKGGFNTNSSSLPELGTRGGFSGTGFYDAGSVPTDFGTTAGMDRPGLLEPTGGAGSIAFAWTSDNVDLVAAWVRRKNGNYHAGSQGDGAHPVYTTLADGRVLVTRGGLTGYYTGEEVLNTSSDNTSLLLKSTLRFGGGQSLDLGFSRFDSEYGDIMPSQIWSGIPYQGYLNTIKLDTWTARYRWNPEDNDLIDLKADLFHTALDNRVMSSLQTTTGVPFPQYYFTDDTRTGLTLSNTSRFSTAWGDMTLVLGGNISREKTGLPSEYADNNDVIASMPTPRSGWRRESGAFAALTWTPTNRLTLDASLRYSNFETWDENLVRTNDYVTTPPTVTLTPGMPLTRSGHAWSPILGARYEVSDGFSIYAKFAGATRMPSIFESLNGFSVANSSFDLYPERSKSFEIGTNITRNDVLFGGDELRIHAAYFDNRIDDYITRANRATVNAAGRTIYVLGALNLEKAEMRGIEVSASYSKDSFFGALSWNHYTHTMFCARDDGSIRSTESRCAPGGIRNSYALQHVPPKDTVTLTLGHRFLDDRLTLGSRITYVGSRAAEGMGTGTDLSSVVGEIRPGTWKPYTLVNVFASYDFDEATRIDFGIENLTDRYYLDGLSASLVPGPGRTIRVNFSRKF